MNESIGRIESNSERAITELREIKAHIKQLERDIQEMRINMALILNKLNIHTDKKPW